ncbi:tryptophan-rich sensory protein [Sporosarcina limicola]|uniref:Membrane-associated HD superfamily phosphohydrolase n=1 Tax=Sporosarcina limicola TaxID=34101 RepID=A0A927ML03_9BACL|nr:tryptophan-rich sensory protein [Sporosarcina limicola]MBE1555883.1 membrane-associated HD superfamily phosphohydrolase [Sporosarcina limicola]
MFRMILMILSFIAVVTLNVVANSFPLNGQTTGEIASKLPVLFTPAGYVFLIWAIIYALLAFWLYGFWQNNKKIDPMLQNRRSALFIFSCLLNIVWILLWHYGFFNWTVVVMMVLLMTLLTLYFTYPKRGLLLLGRMPIAVYLGWGFIATIANVSYVLTLHEWSGWGLSDPLWTVIYLTIAATIALHFLYHHADIALNIVFMWAFIGIAVKNGANELFISAAALFLTATIGIFIYFTRKSKK